MTDDRTLLELAAREELVARRAAHILGEFSAAALAIKELERRRANGEDVFIFSHRQYWLVGPSAPLAAASIGQERK